MKKLLCALMFVFVLGLSSLFISFKEVKAESANGFRVEEVFSDKFNKETLDPSWVLKDSTLELNYNALHCISPVPYGSGPIMNAFRLSDRTKICFTIYPQSGQSESNISFNIGMASPTTSQKEPDVDCKVQFWNDQLVFTDWQHNLAVNHEKESEHVLRGFNGLYSDLLRTDIALYIERKTETSTLIYAEYSRDGEIVYTNKSMPFELISPREPYGYCGFFWDVVEMDLTNFEAYNDDRLVFSDDLSRNTLTYPATDPFSGNFHVNDSLNESKVYVSRVSSVKMDSANEAIINKNSLTKLKNVSNPYEVNYQIKINELNDNSFFGFGFGLDESDERIDKKNAIGFIKNDNLTASVVVLKDGVIDRSNNYQISLTKLGNGKYIDYKVVFDSANNAYLTVNGLTFKFSNINFYGEVGIGLVSLGEGASSSAEIREFSLKRNVFNEYNSSDASNDFTGVKIPDESDPNFTEPYINNQKYYLGGGVTLEEDWTTGESNLVFSNVGPYSGFSYCQEFSEWILEFDIELYSRTQGHMFGISFGRKSIVDVLLSASTSCSALLFRFDGSSTTSQIVYGANTKFENGSTSQVSDLNFFDEKNTKYHLMFIGKNRNVYAYYKAEDDPISDMGILRAKISNVNIDGYVSIVGNNGVSFKVSNYKLVNLLDGCTEDSNLTLRETFNDKNNISKELSLDPMSSVSDGKLTLNNSTVQTNSKNLFEIVRFTLDEVEGSFQVLFSNDKKVLFDKENDQIIIKEGQVLTTYDASSINLKNIKGKRFEIIILGNSLSIGYKGYYDPLDKMSETIVNHTFISPLEEDYIVLSANGKVVVDDLYLFSLDNSKECLTINYEDDPNNAQVWIVKPDFDPSKVYKEKSQNKKSGCKSALSATLIPTLVLGVFGAIILKKKKEVK